MNTVACSGDSLLLLHCDGLSQMDQQQPTEDNYLE
jgi:hypothetical protein